MGEINFFTEDIDFQIANESSVIDWLKSICFKENFELDTINYIFCSDEYLLQINKDYLQHDYYTDIITFDNSETEGTILSDIFISLDRIRDNCSQQNTSFENELHRVLVHGLLHLLGYKDKSSEDQLMMRQKEDACLSLLS